LREVYLTVAGWHGEVRDDTREEALADPSLLRHQNDRRQVRDYLDDPTVSPLLFVRMAARDPERQRGVP
jgi:hypothetical protein